MIKRVHVRVTGRVQNVGYRAFVLHTATRLSLSGWVQNMPEGNAVEFEAQGESAAVDALLSAARGGPIAARVQDLQVTPLAPSAQAPAIFTVR